MSKADPTTSNMSEKAADVKVCESEQFSRSGRSSPTIVHSSSPSTQESISRTGTPLHQTASSATGSEDPLIVDWEGPNDINNPKKCVSQLPSFDFANRAHSWPYRQKWAATLIVSSFTFISPVSSSMVAPAAMQVAQDLGIHSTVISAMTISVFILGFAVGPLVSSTLSMFRFAG